MLIQSSSQSLLQTQPQVQEQPRTLSLDSGRAASGPLTPAAAAAPSTALQVQTAAAYGINTTSSSSSVGRRTQGLPAAAVAARGPMQQPR